VTNEMAIDGLIRNPSVAIWWDSDFFQATPEFTQYVDSLRTKPDSSWQWVDIARKYDDA
jgi:hypothetical protein